MVSQKSDAFHNISFGRLRRLRRLVLFTYGFFRAIRPNSPTSCARRLTIDSMISTPRSFPNSNMTVRADFHRSSFNFRLINRSVVAVVLGLRQQPNRFLIHLEFLCFFIIDCTVGRLNSIFFVISR